MRLNGPVEGSVPPTMAEADRHGARDGLHDEKKTMLAHMCRDASAGGRADMGGDRLREEGAGKQSRPGTGGLRRLHEFAGMGRPRVRKSWRTFGATISHLLP